MKKILFCFLLFSFTSQSVNSQCLSGIYTIGGTTPDYATFTAAVNSLTTNGVCGSVVFNIRPGTYTEQITIPQITGTSVAHSITFQSENGDSSSVILALPSSSSNVNDFVVFVNGGDHINFEKLTIERTGILNNATVISIQNGSDTLVFRKNWIKNNSIGGGSSLMSSYQLNNLKIVGNKFEKGTEAIYFFLSAASPFLVIDSNTFINQGNASVQLSGPRDFKIRYNHITNCFYGISAGGGWGNAEVIGNIINNSRYIGIDLGHYNESTPPGTPSLLVANNFINSSGAGIKLSECYDVKILFNSVYTTDTSYSPYTQDGCNNTQILNNIFYSASTTPAFKFTNNQNNPFYTSDRNLLFSNGVNLISDYTGYSYSSLALWTAATGNDAHSYNTGVAFVSPPSDLHILYDNFLFNRASWDPLVPKDIDGDSRNPSSPCIGADEFQLPLSDAKVSFLDSPSQPLCGGLHAVAVSIYNGGQSALTSVVINWSVDNIIQPSYNWSGNILSSNFISNISIGNYNFTGNATHIIKVWTSNLSTGTDLFPGNDTLTYTLSTHAMSGTYTIGGASPDYTTLNAAYTDLFNRGICSSVVFNIRPGSYNFGEKITHINGTSTINTITFQSENNDSTSVIINSFGDNIGVVSTAVFINSGDDYIFKHLTLCSSSFSSGYQDYYCAIIAGYSSDNKFYNCFMNICYSSSGDTGTPIYLTGDNRRSKFVNNRIASYYHGSSLVSYSNTDLLVKNNYMSGSIAIQSSNYYHHLRDTIENNDCAGIDVTCDSSIVNNNNCRGSFGIQGKYYAIGYNNFIYGTAAIRGSHTTFVHNTVKGHNDTYYDGLVSIADSAIVKNNIFYNDGTSDQTNYMMIYQINNALDKYNYMNSNWNDFYSPQGNNIDYSGNLYTLAAWKATSGYESNSVSHDPHCVSSTDLHVYNPGGGIPSMPSYSFCTNDIDGDLRSSSSPKAGADEFATTTGTFDGAMSDLVIGTNICYGNQPIKVKIYNNESSTSLSHAVIKWKVNGVNQLSYSWTGLIPAHDTSSVFTIGNYFFNGGNNSIKVWITLSNGFSDPNAGNDTLTRSSFVNYPVNIGNDTTICEGNSLTLNAGNFMSYLWSNGSTAQTISANINGNYSVAVVDANTCSSSDAIHITIPISNLGRDTSICASTNILLDAGQNFTSYLWSTGATAENITAAPGHVYWVTSQAINSCTSRDTITINSNPLPIIHLGNDTTLCANFAITLSPGNYSSYNWTGGYTASTFSDYGGRFGIPNIIWVTVKNSFGCSNSDTINVYAKQVNATITCSGTSAILDAGPNYALYNWIGDVTGLVSTHQTASVTVPDTYTINAEDQAGCEALSKYNIGTFSPVSNFTFTSVGLTCNFTCPSNGLQYLWDFGDGHTSAVQNPSHIYLSSGNYIVKLTVSNACGNNMSNQPVSLSNVGIADPIDNEGTQITIYPNPFISQTTLIFNKEQKNIKIKIMDVLGKEIKSINFTGKELLIEKSEMQAGIYFVQIIDADKNVVNKKIIIQ